MLVKIAELHRYSEGDGWWWNGNLVICETGLSFWSIPYFVHEVTVTICNHKKPESLEIHDIVNGMYSNSYLLLRQNSYINIGTQVTEFVKSAFRESHEYRHSLYVNVLIDGKVAPIKYFGM